MSEPRLIPPTARTIHALVLSTTGEPPTGLCAVARLRFEVEGTVLLLHDPRGEISGNKFTPPLPPAAYASQNGSFTLAESVLDPRIARVDARALLTVGDAEGRTGVVVLSAVAAYTLAVGGWKGVARDEHLYVSPTRLVSQLAEEDRRFVTEAVRRSTPGQTRVLGGPLSTPPDDARSAWEARVDLVTPAWLIERLVETEVEQQTPLARPNRGWLRRMLGVSQ